MDYNQMKILITCITILFGTIQGSLASANSSCRNRIASWKGTFVSTGYKSGYPANMDCYWLVTVQQGNIIEITFKDFSVKESLNCTKDYVELHDGPEVTNTSRISRLCGSSLTRSVFTSRGHVMLIRMRTDATGSDRGFKMTHQGLCHVNLTSSHGVIRSPGYPSGQGPITCDWLIDRGPGYYTTITVDVFSFNINHTNCDTNYVKIYDVQMGSHDVLTLCRYANFTNITIKGPMRVSMVIEKRNIYTGLQISFNTSDIDKCANKSMNILPCIKTARCDNKKGFFSCTCNKGYQGNGQSCSDVDECLTNNHNCHPNTTICLNTPGSFSCPCKTGYVGSHNNCTDIDECALTKHNCHAKAECTNSNGSFICQCIKGFRGNGVSCSDINECLERSHSCRAGSICINKEGSYTCPCRDGFEYNRNTAQCISGVLTLPPPMETEKTLSPVEITGIVIGAVLFLTLVGLTGWYLHKRNPCKGSRSSYASEGEDVAYYQTDHTASRDYEFHNLSFHDVGHQPKRYSDQVPAYGNYIIEDQAHYHDNDVHRFEPGFDQLESVEV